MEVIEERNVQYAIWALRDVLDACPQVDDGKHIWQPVSVALAEPTERVVSGRALWGDPAKELLDALSGLLQAKALVVPAAASLGTNTRGFHFSTTALAVRMDLDWKGAVRLTAFVADTDLMGGVFGQLGLQLSLLLELVAHEAERTTGTLTIIHTGASISTAHCEALYKTIRDQTAHDAGVPLYADDFWGDAEMFCEVQENAVGYKSGFFRHVVLPLTRASRLNADAKKDEARAACREIHDSGWRIAMETYIG